MRVCVQEYAGICHKFIVDLNNTSPDGESLKARPMKNSTSVLWFCSADPLLCANAAGPTAHKTHAHPLTSPLQALCCGGNSVDADIITPRPLRNITDREWKYSPRQRHHTTVTVIAVPQRWKQRLQDAPITCPPHPHPPSS